MGCAALTGLLVCRETMAIFFQHINKPAGTAIDISQRFVIDLQVYSSTVQIWKGGRRMSLDPRRLRLKGLGGFASKG